VIRDDVIVGATEAKSSIVELQVALWSYEACVHSEEVAWQELEPHLFDIFKQRAEKVGFVQGDDAVEFQYVAEVIDRARAAGVDRVGLISKELAQK